MTRLAIVRMLHALVCVPSSADAELLRPFHRAGQHTAIGFHLLHLLMAEPLLTPASRRLLTTPTTNHTTRVYKIRLKRHEDAVLSLSLSHTCTQYSLSLSLPLSHMHPVLSLSPSLTHAPIARAALTQARTLTPTLTLSPGALSHRAGRREKGT